MVDAVRSACSAWAAGDLAGIRELYHDDATADGGALWPEGSGSVQGADRIVATFASIMSVFERSELIPEGFLEAGDTLVVPLLWRGVLAGSSGVVEQRIVGTYRFKDGLIVFLAWYADLHEALETLGLPASAADALVMEARFTG
jgi:ketosteroid isomerase-like protein